MGSLKKWAIPGVLVISAAAFLYFNIDKIWAHAAVALDGTNHSATIVFTDIFGLLFGSFLVWLAFYLGDAEPTPANGTPLSTSWHIGRNLFVSLAGALLGWGFAMANTPFGPEDADALNSIMKTLSVFLSGYLVSKLDRFLESTLFEANKPTMHWVSMGFFSAAFILSAIVVFVNRIYMNEQERLAELSFTIMPDQKPLVFGPEQIRVDGKKIIFNGSELAKVEVAANDFVRLFVVTREVQINGQVRGKAEKSKAKVSVTTEPTATAKPVELKKP